MIKKIFVVEDDEMIVDILQTYIEAMGYQFAGTADSGEAALEQIKLIQPDVVLMDILLNGAMDGIEVAARLQAESTIPVIYLTSYAEDELPMRARLTGSFAYVLKPISSQELKTSIETCIHNSEIEHRQQRIFDSVMHSITEQIKLHDPFLNKVQTRAAQLAAAIAAEMHLPGPEIKGIRIAAMLHGVGLTGLPADLFHRSMSLQGMEKALFQSHPEIAWQLLKDVEFICPVAEMVHQHMERLDGSGFPRGLSNDAIIPGARILAVACNVARALTPYGGDHTASVEDTLREFEAGSGKLYDAKVVAACAHLFREKSFSFRA